MSERISLRELSRRLGVSHTAINKAVSTGRIILGDDNRVDSEEATTEWWDTTTKTSIGDSISKGYQKARTMKELYSAQLKKLDFEREKASLIEKDKALAFMFAWARNERESWLNWTSRASPEMASEIKQLKEINNKTIQGILDRYVKKHLTELGNIKLKME